MALERFGAISTAKMNNFEAVAAPGAGDDSGDGYGVGSVWVDITNDNAYMCVDASAAAAVWVQMNGGGVGNHDILDGSVHQDSVADGVTAGSIIIGNDTPKWDELVISVPAADILNVLGIANGETTPSWKATHDGVNPADIAAAASPGTSLISAHRDHVHDHPDIAADLHTVYFLADGSRAMSGDIDLDGNNLADGGVIHLREQAVADADVAGQGQIWVKSGAPNTLYFTDEDGTDVQLGAGGAGGGNGTIWAQVHHVSGATPDILSTVDNRDGIYGVSRVGGATDDGTARWSLRIPSDFDTLTKAVICCVATFANGTLRYNVATRFDAAGIDIDTTSDSIASTDLAMFTDDLAEIDISAALTGLAADDILGIEFEREGSHANDTITANFFIFGIAIEYTT